MNVDIPSNAVVKFAPEDLARMNGVLRHRLGNMISGIRTSVSVVFEEIRDAVDPETVEYFPLILRECDLMEDMCRRLNMVFDDVQTGGAATIEQTLERVVCEVKVRFPSADIRVDVSDKAASVKLRGDTCISSALVEILRNACESTPRGAVVVTVSHAGSRMKIRIADGGAGVAESDFDTIFLPFYTTKSKHLGIGLTIARRLLAIGGGSVSVSRGEKGGFAVEAVLPVDE